MKDSRRRRRRSHAALTSDLILALMILRHLPNILLLSYCATSIHNYGPESVLLHSSNSQVSCHNVESCPSG